MNKLVVSAVSISVLIIALSVAYYFVIFLPDKATKEGLQKVLEESAKEVERERIQQAYSDCAIQAETEAAALLREKSTLPGGYIYKEAVKKGMYLKDDYNYAFNVCLQSKGIAGE